MKWEYNYISCSKIDIGEMDKMGFAGWELVSVTHTSNVRQFLLIFKRPFNWNSV